MIDFIADTVDFVAGFGDKSATTWIWQLVAVDIVTNLVDFVTRMSFRLCRQCVWGQSDTVDRVEFNYVASVYLPRPTKG